MLEREAASSQQPLAPETVCSLWESVTGHRLSAGRRVEFLARSEVTELAKLDDDLLRIAAAYAVESNPHGYLLLKDWLKEARLRGFRSWSAQPVN